MGLPEFTVNLMGRMGIMRIMGIMGIGQNRFAVMACGLLTIWHFASVERLKKDLLFVKIWF